MTKTSALADLNRPPDRGGLARAARLLSLATSVFAWVLGASAALCCASATAGAADGVKDKLLLLGTGPVGGAFRPIGESLCNTINADRRTSEVRCVAMGTAGSVFNLHAVARGAIPLGLAQEDLVYAMRNDPTVPYGQALRVVALAHDSPIAVMVRRDSGITHLSQLAGKRLNLGNRGSGQFAISQALLGALDLRVQDLAAASYMPTSEFEAAFCGGKVDAVIEAVAHPSALFQRLGDCGGQFIDIPDAVAARMVTASRWFSRMKIGANTYPFQSQTVNTLGMRNVLVAGSGVDAEAVYRLFGSLKRRHEELLRSQPLLASMVGPDQMLADSLPAPLHDGVQRALAEQRPWWIR